MKPNLQLNGSTKRNAGEIFSSAIFYLAILIFINGFNFSDNPPSGWYQQFLPNINGASIRDVTFTDSLKGYAVTSIGGSNSYILKTTNGGDNWTIKFLHVQPFVRVEFINADTGFTNAFTKIFKTTNAGENWNAINLPNIFGDDMFVLSEDTIWLAMSEPLTGGVFRTTNGGASWDHQFSGGNQNPNKIYMYNVRIGFMSNSSALPNIYKTTNGGVNWTLNVSGQRFFDISFVDSLTGWRSSVVGNTIYKTTNGGVNWFTQIIPSGGIIITGIEKFSVLNRDTVWGAGGLVSYGTNGSRGILYRTTNGGNNWLFQVPDTSIHITGYFYVQFVDKDRGWAYHPSQGGIHTTTGGNGTFYTGLQQISSKIPEQFKLYQNYPNPFNPRTVISYELQVSAYVKLIVYDINGKKVIDLVNQKQNVGKYEVDFSGNGLSSGVYLYQIVISKQEGGEVYRETKKAILIK